MYKDGNLVATVMMPIEVLDNKGLRFKREDEVWLELLISDTAISDDRNDVTHETVYDWLWQQGKGIANHLKSPKRMKLYYRDVSGTMISTSIDNIEAKDIPTQDELLDRRAELLQILTGFSSIDDQRHISEIEDELRQIDIELERYED